MIYFGWLRSQAIAETLGYDESLLELGAQDYLLRSVQPVSTMILIAVAALWPMILGHNWLKDALARGRFTRLVDPAVGQALQLSAIPVSIGSAVAMWTDVAHVPYVIPGLFLLCAWAIGYGTWLPTAGRKDAVGFYVAPRAARTDVRWAVTVLLLMSVFLITTQTARRSGAAQAEANIERLATAAVVTVVSDTALHLPGERRVGDDHVSDGLALMFTAGGRHFLLPTDYDRASNAKVHTVDAAGVRLDFDNSRSVPCSFDGLKVGDQFEPGARFRSAGVDYEVSQFEPPTADDHVSVGPPRATVETLADGETVIRLTSVVLSLPAGSRYDEWWIGYSQYAAGVGWSVGDDQVVASVMPELATDVTDDGSAGLVVDGRADGVVGITGIGDGLANAAVGGVDLLVACQPLHHG